MERKIVIADTGFVVALLNRSDVAHQAVVKIYKQFKKILLPQTVLAEVAYLTGKAAGISVLATFLRGLHASRFFLTELTDNDISRVADILDKYADSRIDFVDATVMAVAERFTILQLF
jgi:predicted nucleic acid-binding protein